MPRRRRYKRKRRTKRRSRRGRRKTSLSRWGVTKYNIHKYRRFARPETLALSSNLTGEVTKGFSFLLSDLAGVAEFTSLYDQYRIDYVTLKIMWSPKDSLTVDPNAPGQSIYPVLYYYNDYDDDTAPSTLADIRERSNLRTVRISPNRTININVKPAIASSVYQSTTATAYAPKWNTKLDAAYPDIPHFGLKMACSYLHNQTCGSLLIEKIFHVTMFGTR